MAFGDGKLKAMHPKTVAVVDVASWARSHLVQISVDLQSDLDDKPSFLFPPKVCGSPVLGRA